MEEEGHTSHQTPFMSHQLGRDCSLRFSRPHPTYLFSHAVMRTKQTARKSTGGTAPRRAQPDTRIAVGSSAASAPHGLMTTQTLSYADVIIDHYNRLDIINDRKQTRQKVLSRKSEEVSFRKAKRDLLRSRCHN